MNELEIATYLSSDSFTSKYFKGVLAYDQLSVSGQNEGLYVVNTDDSFGDGKHWVCVFLSDINEYFDSLGKPPTEVKPFLENMHKPYVYSTQRLQSETSDVCGDYCILYAYFRCRGYKLDYFMNQFSVDPIYNDVLVAL